MYKTVLTLGINKISEQIDPRQNIFVELTGIFHNILW